MFKEFEELVVILDTARQYQHEAQEKILQFLLKVDSVLKNHIVNAKILAEGTKLLLAEAEVKGEKCKMYFHVVDHDVYIDVDGNNLNIHMACAEHINVGKTYELLKTFPSFVQKICVKAKEMEKECKRINKDVILLLQQLQQ